MKKIPLAHRRLLPRWQYGCLLIALVAGEYPLNAVVFEVFGQGRLETTCMALGVCVALVGLAHFLGVLLARIGTVEDRTRTRVERFFALVLGLVIVLGVGRLGEVRGTYLSGMQEQTEYGIPLGQSTLVSFTLIQILILCVAVAAAFFTHNEVADEWRWRQREVRRVARKRDRAEAKLTRAEQELVAKQSASDMTRLRFLETAAGSAHWYDFLRWAYRSTLARFRGQGSESASLFAAPMPPIEPGAWTTRPLPGPYSLPEAEDEVALQPPIRSGFLRRQIRLRFHPQAANGSGEAGVGR